MTDTSVTPKRTRPAGVSKPRKGPKAKVAPFVAIVAEPGDRDMLSAPNQEVLHNLFQSFTPEQQSAITQWMNTIANAPVLTDGYKKVFRFWRRWQTTHQQASVKL